MATFTIDLLTGKVFLFSGNFNGSGSTPTSGSTYTEVSYYADLPLPASAYTGEVYLVLFGSGSYVLNRKEAGLYLSNGLAWVAMPSITPYFSSANFQVYDSVVNTKGLTFVTSGITSGFKKLKIQNSDGTIAYLTDLNTKLDTSVFSTYTGTTAPNQFLSNVVFGTFTGTTLPANYLKKSTFATYTGTTAPGQFASKSFLSTYTGTTAPATFASKANALTGGTNQGSGQGIFTGSTANKLKARSIKVAGSNLSISGDSTSITITGTDVDNYVPITTYQTYTGTTAPNAFASKANALTGATNLSGGTGIYTSVSGNKIQLKSIKGAGTVSISTDSTSITISGTSSSGSTPVVSSSAIQLLDTAGGKDVNGISATTITWTTQTFSGTSLSFTGGSRIYVKASGTYEVSYSFSAKNNNGSPKNIGSLIRKNGNTDVTPMSSSSFNQNANNNISTNIMPQYLITLSNGDYVELFTFRIGITGESYSMPNTAWIKMKKI